MRHHREKCLLPYSQDQLFSLVADVKSYPEFLPWCLGARILETNTTGFDAELAIGFKMVRESFKSRVILNRPSHIEINYLDGPFKDLKNSWLFKKTDQTDECQIDFFLEFEFKSPILESLIGLLLEDAIRRMVNAFEARANHIYR